MYIYVQLRKYKTGVKKKVHCLDQDLFSKVSDRVPRKQTGFAVLVFMLPVIRQTARLLLILVTLFCIKVCVQGMLLTFLPVFKWSLYFN